MEVLTKQDLQDAIRTVAPLVEANPVLREWLRQNGIDLYNNQGTWFFQDNRPGFEGTAIQDTCATYAEALIFALEFVKKHLQETAKGAV